MTSLPLILDEREPDFALPGPTRGRTRFLDGSAQNVGPSLSPGSAKRDGKRGVFPGLRRLGFRHLTSLSGGYGG